MMLTANKELKKVLKEAEGNGWVFSKGERHIKGKHSSGKTTTISISPSDWRVLENIKKDLKVAK